MRRQLWYLAAGVVVLAPQLYKLFLPFREVFNGFISDDSFYYYKVAQNITHGLGATFDGINPTNGFHPLWMAICVLVSFLIRDSSLYLHCILLVNLLLCGWLAGLLFQVFKPRLGTWPTIMLLAFMNWNYRSSMTYFSGLETPLYLLLFVYLLTRLSSICGETTWPSMFFTGLLAGLTFLARTDFVLVLPIIAMYTAYRARYRRPAEMWGSTGIMLLGFAAPAAPYLLVNRILFGHFEQLSGLTKNMAGVSVHRGAEALHALGDAMIGVASPRMLPHAIANLFVVSLLALAGVVALKELGWNWRRMFRQFTGIEVCLVASGAVLAAYYSWNYGHLVRRWHFSVAYLALQLCLGLAVTLLWRATVWRRALRPFALGVASLLLLDALVQVPGAAYQFRRVNYSFVAPVYYSDEVARWLSTHVPPKATVGVWDAGYVGYFSGRTVVNLDGLINGEEFYQYVRDGRGVWQYIVDKRLDYISNYYWGAPTPEHSPIASRLQRVYSVGPRKVIHDGKETFVDWYVWRVLR